MAGGQWLPKKKKYIYEKAAGATALRTNYDIYNDRPQHQSQSHLPCMGAAAFSTSICFVFFLLLQIGEKKKKWKNNRNGPSEPTHTHTLLEFRVYYHVGVGSVSLFFSHGQNDKLLLLLPSNFFLMGSISIISCRHFLSFFSPVTPQNTRPIKERHNIFRRFQRLGCLSCFYIDDFQNYWIIRKKQKKLSS